MKYKELIKLQDFFSLANIGAGFISIIMAIQGKYDFMFALWIIALVCDILDGKIGRIRNTTHDFGKQLDSLADIVSFGVAPAIYGYMLMQTNEILTSILILIPLILFLFAGILRLARYNVQEEKNYTGMPIPVNVLILIILYFINIPLGAYPLIYIILATLMVLPFQVKKPW